MQRKESKGPKRATDTRPYDDANRTQGRLRRASIFNETIAGEKTTDRYYEEEYKIDESTPLVRDNEGIHIDMSDFGSAIIYAWLRSYSNFSNTSAPGAISGHMAMQLIDYNGRYIPLDETRNQYGYISLGRKSHNESHSGILRDKFYLKRNYREDTPPTADVRFYITGININEIQRRVKHFIEHGEYHNIFCFSASDARVCSEKVICLLINEGELIRSEEFISKINMEMLMEVRSKNEKTNSNCCSQNLRNLIKKSSKNIVISLAAGAGVYGVLSVIYNHINYEYKYECYFYKNSNNLYNNCFFANGTRKLYNPYGYVPQSRDRNPLAYMYRYCSEEEMTFSKERGLFIDVKYPYLLGPDFLFNKLKEYLKEHKHICDGVKEANIIYAEKLSIAIASAIALIIFILLMRRLYNSSILTPNYVTKFLKDLSKNTDYADNIKLIPIEIKEEELSKLIAENALVDKIKHFEEEKKGKSGLQRYSMHTRNRASNNSEEKKKGCFRQLKANCTVL